MPSTRSVHHARAGASLLAPAYCGGCGDALSPATTAPPARGWCAHCVDRWGPAPGWWDAAAGQCPGWAAAVYRGRVRRALLQAKRGAPEAAASLLLQRCPAGLLPGDALITWIPAHPRRALRGPDAGRSLAIALARREGLPAERLLWRVPWARRQAGRTVAERTADPHRLGLRAAGRVPATVVLVDDVRTTGTTLDQATELLRRAGAEHVVAVTVALAPAEVARLPVTDITYAPRATSRPVRISRDFALMPSDARVRGSYERLGVAHRRRREEQHLSHQAHGNTNLQGGLW